ncbi:hypothetical protein O7A70_32540 [Mesorhizobium sp. Cs1299R1N1]|uniref:hypothetical protein n=1 Tax=Mesorhizobium sp. Cs1299R1N1 TaxID=3015172 RepID=UPI00301DADFB
MAKLEKRPVKMSDPSYRGRVAEKRKANLDRSAQLTERRASERIKEYSRPNKQQKYARDLDILDKVNENTRGEVGYKLLGHRKLRIESKGQLTRERGIILKTRKVIERSADAEAAVLRRYEKDSWRQKKTEEYDKDNQLRTKSVVRKDGRYKEDWVRDDKGILIRTRYFNNRWQDGRLFRPVSEVLSRADQSGYRMLIRRKGFGEKVFERDPNGNLELMSRKGPLWSKYARKSADRKTSTTDVSHLGGLFRKSYQSRLDQNGNVLSKDMRYRRVLWNKESAEYDDRGQMRKATHTLGKLYKKETEYLDGAVKKMTRSILGIKFSAKIRDLSDSELEARKLRTEEATLHAAAWEPEPVVDRSREEVATRPGALETSLGETQSASRSERRETDSDEKLDPLNSTNIPATSDRDDLLAAMANWGEAEQPDNASPGRQKEGDALSAAMRRRNERVPVQVKGGPRSTSRSERRETDCDEKSDRLNSSNVPKATSDRDELLAAMAKWGEAEQPDNASPGRQKEGDALSAAMRRRNERVPVQIKEKADVMGSMQPERSRSDLRSEILQSQANAAWTRGFDSRSVTYSR